jgi:hypothetical protein
MLATLVGLHGLRRKEIAEDVRLACDANWMSLDTQRNLRLRMREAASGY